MDNEQAKFLLHAYRPSGRDAQDPRMAEALAQAQRDPELGEWFRKQQAWDAAVAGKLKAMPVPPELRAHILAGNRVAIVPLWRRPAVWLAVAACVAILGLTAALWVRPTAEPDFAHFSRSMISQLGANHTGLDMGVHDLQAAREWLRGHQADPQLVLPAALASAPAKGCRILHWDEHQVTMICLSLDGRHHVDLFVIDRADFPDLPPQSRPRLRQVDGVTTASWQAGGRTYLLAGAVPAEELRNYL